MKLLAMILALCATTSAVDKSLKFEYVEEGHDVTETIDIDTGTRREVHKTYFKVDGVEMQHVAIKDFSSEMIVSYVTNGTKCYIRPLDSGDAPLDVEDFTDDSAENNSNGSTDGIEPAIMGRVVEEDVQEFEQIKLDPSRVPDSVTELCDGRTMEYLSNLEDADDIEDGEIRSKRSIFRRCRFGRRKVCYRKRYCCKRKGFWWRKRCIRYCYKWRCYYGPRINCRW